MNNEPKVTVLCKFSVSKSVIDLAKEIGVEFSHANLIEDKEVFVEILEDNEYDKAYRMHAFLGSYLDNPEDSPYGCDIYVGNQLGVSYKSKKGLLRSKTSVMECVRIACKNYTGNTIPCRIIIDLRLPKGNNLKADERIRKLLSDIGAEDPKVTIEYDVKKY